MTTQEWQKMLHDKKLICDTCFKKGKITCKECQHNIKIYIMATREDETNYFKSPNEL